MYKPLIPTDDEVRRVIYASRQLADARTVPAVALMLSEGLTVNSLRKLRWADFDQTGNSLLVPVGRRGPVLISLSPYLVACLCRIRHTTSRFIFSANVSNAPTLSVLIKQLLMRANLATSSADNLVAWWKAQTPTVRRMTATT